MNNKFNLTQLAGIETLPDGDRPDPILMEICEGRIQLFYDEPGDGYCGVTLHREEVAVLLNLLLKMYPLDALGAV